MRSLLAVTCPRCGSSVRVASLVGSQAGETNDEPHGTILKQCGRCRVWSWMTPQPQEAT